MLTPAQMQRAVANFRRGQAAFNNYNREVQIMNALGALALKRTKVARGLRAPRAHAQGSANNRRNNAMNAAIQRNLNALNANKNRLERELINLRKRLLANYYMGTAPLPPNHAVLTNYNFSSIGAGINRLRKKRIGRFIRRAITRPGGVYSRMAMKSTLNNIKSLHV
jgi:hypothetical protein